MNFLLNRREAISATAALGATLALGQDQKPKGERLRIGVVGLAGQGEYNWKSLLNTQADVVAICDVDDGRTGPARKQFPKATFHTDFRKMIDAKGLDAVLCATPDHTHFPIAATALMAGLHVYCEKPLAHTVWEVRQLRELAKKHKRITQMGTQIHANENYHRVVETIRQGIIGDVKEVHCWVGGAWNGTGKRPEKKPVPQGLDWDLWQGPVLDREYAPEYVPFNWRRYWAFGGGRMADMACHHMDLPFWALNLRHPTKVTAKGSPVNSETGADWIQCEFEFPARDKMPALTLTWHDGDKRPKQFADGKLPKWGDGTLFVGTKGMLLADYGRMVLLPDDQFKGVAADKSLARSPGHHKEFVTACLEGKKSSCDFDYSGALTETVLLGVVSYRSGESFEWDAETMKCKGAPKAQALLTKEYRKGWNPVG